MTFSQDSFEVWGINIGPTRDEPEGAAKAEDKIQREEKACKAVEEEVAMAFESLQAAVDEMVSLAVLGARHP